MHGQQNIRICDCGVYLFAFKTETFFILVMSTFPTFSFVSSLRIPRFVDAFIYTQRQQVAICVASSLA